MTCLFNGGAICTNRLIFISGCGQGNSERVEGRIPRATELGKVTWSFLKTLLIIIQKLLREAQLWSQLDHTNITPFYGISFDMGVPLAPCLVSPYYENGHIATYLQKHPDSDRMAMVSRIFLPRTDGFLTLC